MDLGEAARIGGHHRHAGRHGFERGQAKAFIFRREEEEVGDRQDLFHLFLFPNKTSGIIDVEFAAKTFRLRSFGTVADEEAFAGNFLMHDLEDTYDVLRAFYLPEVVGWEQYAL